MFLIICTAHLYFLFLYNESTVCTNNCSQVLPTNTKHWFFRVKFVADGIEGENESLTPSRFTSFFITNVFFSE